MLLAAKQQVKRWDENNRFAAQMQIGNFEARNKAGISHLAWETPREQTASRKGQLVKAAAPLVPKFIRRQYNIVLESEVDVILDASGFAFSDQWPAKKTETMAAHCARWKREGKKIIFLPQALGPFENARSRSAFAQILRTADRVFARDRISYEHAISALPSATNVRLAPDFTNLLQGETPDYIEEVANRPCVVPNKRMLDKTSPEVRASYLAFLTAAIHRLVEQGLDPFILIHETHDFELGQQLRSQLNRNIPVVQEENPLYLKGILGSAYLVIGSRFHSLVSALSQGTPCLGTGWSHKYQMLFADYNCPDLLLDVEGDIDKSLTALDLLTEPRSRTQIVQKVEAGAAAQKTLSRQMWAEVKDILYPDEVSCRSENVREEVRQ